MEEVSVMCGDCSSDLNENPGLLVADRQPCPHCGSLKRQFNQTLIAIVKGHPKIIAKGKRANAKKPFIEVTEGEDLFRKTGSWRYLTRIIDRARNWYYEHIVDIETGEVAQHCDERLTDHWGHGSAKYRR